MPTFDAWNSGKSIDGQGTMDLENGRNGRNLAGKPPELCNFFAFRTEIL
jgi:hypothetical protein